MFRVRAQILSLQRPRGWDIPTPSDEGLVGPLPGTPNHRTQALMFAKLDIEAESKQRSLICEVSRSAVRPLADSLYLDEHLHTRYDGTTWSQRKNAISRRWTMPNTVLPLIETAFQLKP